MWQVTKCHECRPRSQERQQIKPSVPLDGSLSLDFSKDTSALQLNSSYYYLSFICIFLNSDHFSGQPIPVFGSGRTSYTLIALKILSLLTCVFE